VQFIFLFIAMDIGMPTGLASLVLQASAPFTVLLGALLLRERISPRQGIGIGLAVLGMAAIAVSRAQVAAALPVLLTLLGALGWAFGNLAGRKAAPPNPLHLTLWMSVVPPVPMLVLSLLVEGPQRIGHALRTSVTAEALPSVLGLLYIVVVATLLGYGLWNSLLARHPSNVVAPFSMLVPVVGVLSSWLIFGELIDRTELVAGVAVVGGVLLASRQPRRPAAAPTERALVTQSERAHL
jgi:O-acetylserine/cysteine efflux transporter